VERKIDSLLALLIHDLMEASSLSTKTKKLVAKLRAPITSKVWKDY
jgi:hypothetical protein